jgi:succinate dehydrogenase / fumarate reductase, cytochrome b subunit
MSPRPLSPHLGVYKFMYTMSLSILHRITGLAASFGFLVFAWWLMALATGHDAYQQVMELLSTPLGKLLLVGFTFAFVYHFCAGIRHLVLDTGHGLERAQARRSGALVIVAALVITALVVWLGCSAISEAPGAAPLGVAP